MEICLINILKLEEIISARIVFFDETIGVALVNYHFAIGFNIRKE